MVENFCVVMLFGAGLLCSGPQSTTVDSTCDNGRVTLPARWKLECVDTSGRLRDGLDIETRKACTTIAANNRRLKSRCLTKSK